MLTNHSIPIGAENNFPAYDPSIISNSYIKPTAILLASSASKYRLDLSVNYRVDIQWIECRSEYRSNNLISAIPVGKIAQ